MGKSSRQIKRSAMVRSLAERVASGEMTQSQALGLISKSYGSNRKTAVDLAGRVKVIKQARANRAAVARGEVNVTNVTLGRTASKVVSGKQVIGGQGVANPHTGYQIRIGTANRDFFKGLITPEQYKSRISRAKEAFGKERKEQSERLAYTSTKQATSEAIKQRETRSIAQSQGVAVGTIAGETANVSAASQTGKLKTQTITGSTRPTPKETPIIKEPVQELQGPVKPSLAYTLSLNEKLGGKQPEEVTIPAGSLDYVYGQPQQDKVFDTKRYANFGQAAYAGFGNALRFSDAVDRGEVKPQNAFEWATYYASRGLRPFYNIPAAIMGYKTQPTLSGTILDTGIDLALTGKTKTHDPVGDFIRKDPYATLVELPAEGAMFAAGAVASKAATGLAKKYSPLLVQTKKIPIGDKEVETVYRGITWQNKPVVGVQQGKLVRGYDPEQVAVSLGKVKPKVMGRDGLELSVGTGIEKNLIYSEDSLSALVRQGLIPTIGKERALQAKKIALLGVKTSSGVGEFGPKPIVGLSKQQSEALFKGVVKGQKAGDIESVHGSTALRPQLPKPIQEKAGDAVKLGDIDVHPTGSTPIEKAARADRLIQGFAAEFPLKPGQRLSIKNVGAGVSSNRAIELSGVGIKEPRKVFEVVLKTDDNTAKYGISQGDKILGENIPKNTVVAKDFPLKLKTADYQLLTNIKQVISFQTGKDTLLDVFPSSGRTKDIVRAYWNVKGKAVWQGGEKGRILDIEAEKFRKLYPGIDFGKPEKGKVLLSSITGKKPSSIGAKSTIQGSSIKSTISNIKPSTGSSISKITSSRGRPSIIDSSVVSKPPLSSKPSKLPSQISKTPSVKPPSIVSTVKTPSLLTSKVKTPSLVKTPTPLTSKPPIITTIPATKTVSLTFQKRTPPKSPWIKLKNTTKKAKEPGPETHNFLGSARVADIVGFRTKKSDITVGDKRTAKLYEDERDKNIKNLRKLGAKNSKRVIL